MLSTPFLLALLFFMCPTYYSQKTVQYREKQYAVYCSLIEANKVHPDSVYGLELTSNGFKDFPREILKFKNLKYLEIGSYYWYSVLDSLTSQERKEFDSLEADTCDRCMVNKFFKANIIYSFPKGIKDLKKLEFCDFSTADIRNWRKFKRIYRYLPHTRIIPLKEGY